MAALAVACGGSEESASATPEVTSLCAYDFEATVRSGPTEGRSLLGVLLVGLFDDGEAGSLFVRSLDGELETVPSALVPAGDRLVVGFEPRTGTIVGTGPLPDGFEDCRATVVGDLAGPLEGDRGDWEGDPMGSNLAGSGPVTLGSGPVTLGPAIPFGDGNSSVTLIPDDAVDQLEANHPELPMANIGQNDSDFDEDLLGEGDLSRDELEELIRKLPTTVNPPPLTLDDPDPDPSPGERDPCGLGNGECIL